MTMLALFEHDETPPPAVTPEEPQAGYEAILEFCYRVSLSGPQVGAGGCGATFWFDDLAEAIEEAEVNALGYGGPVIATIEQRVVKVTGPAKDDRVFIGLIPVRTIGWNPEVPSSGTTGEQ